MWLLLPGGLCVCVHVCLSVFHRFKEVVVGSITGGRRDLFEGAEETWKREEFCAERKNKGRRLQESGDLLSAEDFENKSKSLEGELTKAERLCSTCDWQNMKVSF